VPTRDGGVDIGDAVISANGAGVSGVAHFGGAAVRGAGMLAGKVLFPAAVDSISAAI
jgi:hypothetical protein